MEEELVSKLQIWAKIYNEPSFIPKDPVQFPHRFEKKQDIEISGFLTAWISYGNRKQIVSKANWLHEQMGESPFAWIKGKKYLELPKPQNGLRNTFYRFYTMEDLKALGERLHEMYSVYDSMEDAVAANSHEDPVKALQDIFQDLNGIPAKEGTSACKRIAMFLRWMVRQDEIVDLGIWKTKISPEQLVIPLDTHVHQISLRLGLTQSKQANLKTAHEITKRLSEIFPGDPCLGDFALFGYDIDQSQNGI